MLQLYYTTTNKPNEDAVYQYIVKKEAEGKAKKLQ